MQRGKWFLAVIAVISWFALILQLYILIANTPENGLTKWTAVARFLAYFTILSNLLVAISSSVIITFPRSRIAAFLYQPSALAAVAVYILIVGIVYNIVLRSLWQPQGLQRLADELLHVITPLLYLSYWIIFAPKRALRPIDALRWLTFPFWYLVYALLRGHWERFYPYPFIDVAHLGYVRVLLNSSVLLCIFVAVGLLFVFGGRKLAAINRR